MVTQKDINDWLDINAESTSLTQLIAGIDKDIKRIFLELPERKLISVLLRYGELYGISKVIYAKNTYPKWKSGEIVMSGMVTARLLNLVPLVLEAGIVFELVRKVRAAYLRKQYLTVECYTNDWFRKVPPVVKGLISYSQEFEFPDKVIEKLQWMASGTGKSAQELLVAIETDDAEVRTQFLDREYAHIARMVSASHAVKEFRHTIELPQGAIAVTISKPPFSIFERIPLMPLPQSKQRRTLTITCKNLQCSAELVTTLQAYDDEPFDCASAEITCQYCGSSFVYSEQDLSRTRRYLIVQVERKLLGNSLVSYDCPLCGTRLWNPLDDVGKDESCPKCKMTFTVPSS